MTRSAAFSGETIGMLPTSSRRIDEVRKLANAIAREYERDYVGTEHVLLAILQESEGVGAQVLKKLGVTEAALRREIEKLIKKQMEETWVFGRLPGTPHFKNVMATAIQQCQQLGAREVCTEHVLLALLLEKGSVGYKALNALGLSFDRVRKEVIELSRSEPKPGR